MLQPDRDDDTVEQPTTAGTTATGTPPPAPPGTSTSSTMRDAPRSTADLAGVRTDSDDEAPSTPSSATGGEGDRQPLLGQDDLSGYRSRWDSVQVRFVDEPRDSVKEADALVADLMQRLAQTFAEERASLEQRWERGTDVSTEDLRVAMQRYRSFFDRLLAA